MTAGPASPQQGHEQLAPIKHWADDPQAGLLTQVAAEQRSYFRPPFEVPTIVAINVALVLGAWFLLNPDVVLKYTSLAFLPIAVVIPRPAAGDQDCPAAAHVANCVSQ